MNISYYSLLAEIIRKAQNRTCAETGKTIDVGNECRLLRAYIDNLRDSLEESEAARKEAESRNGFHINHGRA